jgi:glycolate oxidase FAD binding subunit
MTDRDLTGQLQDRIRAAAAGRTPLRLRGGGSKEFYGRTTDGDLLDLSGHRGILDYEPTELVITARGGTPLDEVEAVLGEQGQMLPFDPPRFAPGATLGGAVASGLAGPRRPWCGAPRDLVLGLRLMDGQGQVLKFGGQVMKNVAGYDLSRLMAGALGTLGVLLELSIKVLPRPASELTLSREADPATALTLMERVQGGPVPVTGACWLEGRLYLRLAAGAAGAHRLGDEIGAEPLAEDNFWRRLRDHQLDFFTADTPLWRLSVPPVATPAVTGDSLIDWGGAQRWVRTQAPVGQIRQAAAAVDGHATLFRGGARDGEVFHPLAPPVAALHRRLKAVFDPAGILNPGRLYADI